MEEDSSYLMFTAVKKVEGLLLKEMLEGRKKVHYLLFINYLSN